MAESVPIDSKEQNAASVGAAPRWYAVAVHTRQERAAAAGLKERGFHVFLPTRCERRLWSDRVQRVELALFPGYLFLRAELTAARRVDMLRVRQVYDLVGRIPGHPRIASSIPEEQIESLSRLLESERELSRAHRLERGDEVVISHGPLRGVRGKLLSGGDGSRKIAVEIPLLGRSVRTWVSADDLLETRTEAPPRALSR